jgi:plasmid stability protein
MPVRASSGYTAIRRATCWSKTISRIVIPDLDDAVLARLRERAARHGRTIETEVKAILAEALPPTAPPVRWAAINALREELAASGRTFSDSAELIREDRDR